MTGHRSPHNGNSHNLFTIGKPDGKLVAYGRPVVSVVLFYERVCLF